MDSKGLSPLTSTVLLLVLSVIIGVVVMTWGKSYVEQAAVEKAYSVETEKPSSILQDLDERLQSGEITKEQYDKIKAVVLSQNGK
ncbi:SHOCT domain-containing protein [Candidatus Woesearchaeota archaeon]|nr:SHOCT domain-containing protein [Candidatus Woesearchaeota archaeon]